MAGIPSGEGSGDARDVSTTFTERYPPYPVSVVKFYLKYKDVLGDMLSDLSHLPFEERMGAVRKQLEEKEYSLSTAPPVDTSSSEDEEDEDDDGDDEDQVEEVEENGREGGRLKLIDDEKKPFGAEEHQVYSECERECKKPRLAECVEKPQAPETKNQNNHFTQQ